MNLETMVITAKDIAKRLKNELIDVVITSYYAKEVSEIKLTDKFTSCIDINYDIWTTCIVEYDAGHDNWRIKFNMANGFKSKISIEKSDLPLEISEPMHKMAWANVEESKIIK